MFISLKHLFSVNCVRFLSIESSAFPNCFVKAVYIVKSLILCLLMVYISSLIHFPFSFSYAAFRCTHFYFLCCQLISFYCFSFWSFAPSFKAPVLPPLGHFCPLQPTAMTSSSNRLESLCGPCFGEVFLHSRPNLSHHGSILCPEVSLTTRVFHSTSLSLSVKFSILGI